MDFDLSLDIANKTRHTKKGHDRSILRPTMTYILNSHACRSTRDGRVVGLISACAIERLNSVLRNIVLARAHKKRAAR